jgi:hypothetical protein
MLFDNIRGNKNRIIEGEVVKKRRRRSLDYVSFGGTGFGGCFQVPAGDDDQIAMRPWRQGVA